MQLSESPATLWMHTCHGGGGGGGDYFANKKLFSRDRNYSYPISYQSSMVCPFSERESCLGMCRWRGSSGATSRSAGVLQLECTADPTEPRPMPATSAWPPQPHPLIFTARTGSERFFAFVSDQELYQTLCHCVAVMLLHYYNLQATC